MTTMQQQFDAFCSAFKAGPARGAAAWEGLQDLSRQGFAPARMFVATQKLKSPAPLHDPARAIDLLEALAQGGPEAGIPRQLRAMALYLRGEALICHAEDRLDEGFKQLQAAAGLGHAEAQLSVA